jgi:hypothetical protein
VVGLAGAVLGTGWPELNALYTLRTHVTRILAKLGVRDRVQAVVAAYESGLVQPGTG